MSYTRTTWVEDSAPAINAERLNNIEQGIVDNEASSLGDIAAAVHGATSKATPVDADEIGIYDSVTETLQKVTWANLKAAIIAFLFPRDDHGTISTGSEEISGSFPSHTLTTAGDHTWTFANFTEYRDSFKLRLVVSSGTPTITLTTWTLAPDSAQTLATMVAGTYTVYGETYDGGTSGVVWVGAAV